MTSFLIQHPQARFIIDPAMCSDVHRRVLPQLGVLRAFVAPGKPVIGLEEMLAEAGQKPSDVDFALPTHLHWDHVSGLLELPHDTPVRVQTVEREWTMGGDIAPYGVARGPLLDRRFDTYELDGPPVLTFERSHDLFSDGSVVLVNLPGHTPGSIGILLTLEDDSTVLLAGDAVWHTRQIETLPSST